LPRPDRLGCAERRGRHGRKPLVDRRSDGGGRGTGDGGRVVTARLLEVVQAGVVPYAEALEWQRSLAQARIDGRLPDDLLLLLEIAAERNPGYTGVWTRGRKIASIGIHVKQWVTWHGFALNVANDLAQFGRIVPCGIAGVEMTSVARETGNGKRETGLWDKAIAAVIRGFEAAFKVTAKMIPRDRLPREAAPTLSGG